MATPFKKMRLHDDRPAASDAPIGSGDDSDDAVVDQTAMICQSSDVVDDLKMFYCADDDLSTVVDLTTDGSEYGRNTVRTAEVVKARYIRTLQQFRRICSLIDALAVQQTKLDARRVRLLKLLETLATMYKMMKRRTTKNAVTSSSPPPVTPEPATSVPDNLSDVHVVSSSTQSDVWLPLRHRPDEPEDLSVRAHDRCSPSSVDSARTPVPVPAERVVEKFAATSPVAHRQTSATVDVVRCAWSGSRGRPVEAHTYKVDISAYSYMVGVGCGGSDDERCCCEGCERC